MAVAQYPINISLVAGAAIAKNRFVQMQAAGTIIQAAAAANPGLGISGHPSASGESTQVAVGGTTFIELGATLAAGVMVSANATGQAVAASAVGGEVVCGPLLAGGDAGEVVEIAVHFRTVNA